MSSGTDKLLQIIDFHLSFYGRLKRTDLMAHGEISVATASRALSEYRGRFPSHFNYNANQKAYLATEDFIPVFSHGPEDALRYLAYRQVERIVSKVHEADLNRLPTLSTTLSVENVRKITTALTLSRAISLDYYSASSNRNERLIQPLAVFESAGAWYFRVYDFDAVGFRTFRFSRVLSAKQLATTPSKVPIDTEWEEQVVVTLMPHPKHPNPEALKLDLGLTDKPVCNITTRKALVGYLLNALHVDTSHDADLPPNEHQLYLANRHELSDVPSLAIAPGFGLRANKEGHSCLLPES
ncbi:transcriptional regulator [Endozoicomonas ascidiicola]|uniref:transcriptional regulator n=1 Tax=Endozoicomonas ascidiicola TaxID=1698521 RepID=UPI00082F8F39|nr:WYL domain-containing protein [Endozoicomonas ascidiicola]USN26969.1 WYL domain-containing protein [synthetic construct]